MYSSERKTKTPKMTREEYLNKKRLAERARYRRIKSDPIKYEEHLQKFRRKYESRKRSGIIKVVKDMTQEEVTEARRIWRQKAAAYRQRNSYKRQRIKKSDSSSRSSSE